MQKYLKKIMAMVVTFAIIITSMPIKTYAQQNETKLSGGDYLIINSKLNKLAYYKNGKLIKTFRVATGKASTPTPRGKFKIANKIKNRPYYSGGIPGGSPRNPLGDRWIGLNVGATFGTTYAVHGNNNASSIGKHVSGGCIRMHNTEIRWLYDQIDTGGYALIDYSNKSFTQIADKYGIKLSDPNDTSQSIKNVQSEFKKFANYKNKINLTNRECVINNLDEARDILNSKNTYLNAYNSLNPTEKTNAEIVRIHAEYNKIISMVQFAEACISFYEHISRNADYIKSDIDWTRRLNDIKGNEMGTRGKALNNYNEIVKYGESKDNSARVAYLDQIYTDSAFFLTAYEYLNDGNITDAKALANRIKDTNLKNIAISEFEKYNDIQGHWAETSIKKAMNSGWVDVSNNFRPDSFISRAEFIKIVNRAFSFNEVADTSFNDVSSNSWYYEEVRKAVKAGYIKGCGDNNFRPQENITREQVATIITSIMNNKGESLEKIYSYEDSNLISSWAKSSVEGAIKNGYMGVGDVKFRPVDNITRAESVVTLQRVK